MTGPRIGPSSVGTPITDMIRPIRCGPAAWARIACPTGMIMPPPKPCSTRKTISDDVLHASPHSTEPRRNNATEIIHMLGRRSAPSPTRSTG